MIKKCRENTLRNFLLAGLVLIKLRVIRLLKAKDVTIILNKTSERYLVMICNDTNDTNTLCFVVKWLKSINVQC